MAEKKKFEPVRLIHKDGETEAIVTTAIDYNNLLFNGGYRVAEDQDGLEELLAGGLDNGEPIKEKEAPVEEVEEVEEVEPVDVAATVDAQDVATEVKSDDKAVAEKDVKPSAGRPKPSSGSAQGSTETSGDTSNAPSK